MIQKPIFPTNDFFVENNVTRIIQGFYYGAIGEVTGQVAALNIASIENPAGSGRRVYIRKIRFSTFSNVGALAGFVQIGRTVAIPSAGAASTIQKRAVSDTNEVAIVRITPTVVAVAGTMFGIFTSTITGNINILELSDALIILAPGEAILVNTVVDSSNQFFTTSFEWFEVTPD